MPEEQNSTAMQTVTLNNGRVIENAHIVQMEERLFVYCDGLDIKTGFDAFYQNTDTLVANSYGETHVYNGYSVLYSVSAEYGNCNISLKKG